jgi:hypothetical protein
MLKKNQINSNRKAKSKNKLLIGTQEGKINSNKKAKSTQNAKEEQLTNRRGKSTQILKKINLQQINLKY